MVDFYLLVLYIFMLLLKTKALLRVLVFRERFEEIGKKIKREADAWPHQMAGIRRPMSGPPGTLNTITPCAACKLLRRRCAQECPFSPYFSPHEPHKFASVHKVFGASNVSKMLMVITISKHIILLLTCIYNTHLEPFTHVTNNQLMVI